MTRTIHLFLMSADLRPRIPLPIRVQSISTVCAMHITTTYFLGVVLEELGLATIFVAGPKCWSSVLMLVIPDARRAALLALTAPAAIPLGLVVLIRSIL